MAIGTLVGIVAGHFGGWLATVVMRVTDWFLVMPTLVLAIVLATVMSRSVWTVIIAIGVTSWPTTARLVRAQTIAVESRPYIERARALGGGHRHVMTRHVLPNVMPLVLAQTTLGISTAILTEATLAFLGLGDPTVVSWGGMLQDAREAGAVSSGHWWYLAPPGIAIAFVALAFTLCGRAIETCSTPGWGCPVEPAATDCWRSRTYASRTGVRRARRTRRRPDRRAGRKLGLAGESGCGKSTLALALLRLLPPSAKLSGRDPAGRRGRPHDEMGPAAGGAVGRARRSSSRARCTR